MSDAPKSEEKSILQGMADGFFRGLGFVFKASLIALLFLVIQEYPEESKAVAVWVFESLRDLVMWAMARLSELKEADPTVS